MKKPVLNFSGYTNKDKINEEETFYSKLNFDTKEEYFDYFIKTHYNGQPQRLRTMIDTLLKESELENLINYIRIDELKEFILKYLIEKLERSEG